MSNIWDNYRHYIYLYYHILASKEQIIKMSITILQNKKCLIYRYFCINNWYYLPVCT